MDSRHPASQELHAIKKLHTAFKQWPLYAICIPTAMAIVIFLPIESSGLKITLSLLTLFASIYWALNFAFLKKCPRCQSRMTLPKGNCTSCGLLLDLEKTGTLND